MADVASVDTITSTMTNFVLNMVLNPELQAKAQAEIDRVVGKDRLPTLAEYIERTLTWVLRCIADVPFSLSQPPSFALP